jgi:multiple sugar transport system permease protein
MLAAMAIYSVTRLEAVRRWPGGPVAMSLILAKRILPPVVVALPLYLMAEASGLRDTLTLMVLVNAAINLPVAVWLVQPVLGAKASEQEESSLLDGATHWGILFGIVLPMAKAGVIATAILVFLLSWNECLFAAYLTANNAETLTPWMVGQLSMKEAQVGGGPEELAHLSAAAIFMVAPALVLTVFARRALERAFKTET